MTWLHFGFILLGLYIIWFSRVLLKRRFNRTLLLLGLAHFPYLLANLVAPFRGLLDSNYLGYSFGLISLPQGPLVPLVVGSIVISCFLIMTRAFLNHMAGWWKFTFIVDLLLVVFIAAPVLIDILADPESARLQLGEFMTISGHVVAFLVLAVLSGPTIASCYYAGRKAFRPES